MTRTIAILCFAGVVEAGYFQQIPLVDEPDQLT